MSDTDGSRTLHTEQDRLSLPEVRLDDLLDEVRSRMSMISATQERIRTLLEAVVSIGEGLELDPLLVRITETATSLVDARYGALGVIGPDGEMSRFIPVGLSGHEISRIDHWPRGEGVLGLLIKEPEPLRLKDVADHPESRGFPEGHPPMHTFLGVPIRIRDQVFGNLYMTDKRDGSEFTGDVLPSSGKQLDLNLPKFLNEDLSFLYDTSAELTSLGLIDPRSLADMRGIESQGKNLTMVIVSTLAGDRGPRLEPLFSLPHLSTLHVELTMADAQSEVITGLSSLSHLAFLGTGDIRVPEWVLEITKLTDLSLTSTSWKHIDLSELAGAENLKIHVNSHYGRVHGAESLGRGSRVTRN
jgi:hypothetical protein